MTLALLIITWALAPYNCDMTATQDINGFRIEYMLRGCWPVGTEGAVDCDPPLLRTQAYARTVTSAAIDLPTTPAIGQMYYWRIDQVDGAGNTSKDCQ